MSRFGGLASRSALGVAEAMHAHIIKANASDGERPATATVKVTGTGKTLSGVIIGRKMPEGGVQSLEGNSVLITRAGGRWMIL